VTAVIQKSGRREKRLLEFISVKNARKRLGLYSKNLANTSQQTKRPINLARESDEVRVGEPVG